MIILRKISENIDSQVAETSVRQRGTSTGTEILTMKIELVKIASKKRERRFTAITYEGVDAYEVWSSE